MTPTHKTHPSHHAARLFETRRAMLSSIEHCISPALREAIEQKIEHEERTLRALLEREEEAARAVKATALDARYFTRKPLHEYV